MVSKKFNKDCSYHHEVSPLQAHLDTGYSLSSAGEIVYHISKPLVFKNKDQKIVGAKIIFDNWAGDPWYGALEGSLSNRVINSQITLEGTTYYYGPSGLASAKPIN